ncbi:ORF05L [Marbled eel polyomavirus]|uniref:ORF05L n=1 Tax=Marbled eel polyomavirus TaxID=1662286 RepID=UPI0007C1A77C|nr:ORF05L [Marbled eel polyomavirus]ANC70201.1 ORF05L [Marbled eel polyomavirus]
MRRTIRRRGPLRLTIWVCSAGMKPPLPRFLCHHFHRPVPSASGKTPPHQPFSVGSGAFCIGGGAGERKALSKADPTTPLTTPGTPTAVSAAGIAADPSKRPALDKKDDAGGRVCGGQSLNALSGGFTLYAD